MNDTEQNQGVTPDHLRDFGTQPTHPVDGELRDKICSKITGLKYNELSGGDRDHIDGLMQLFAAHLQAAVQAAEDELIDNLDDIANKPWRAIRYLAEKFESLPGEYNAECAGEYRKLEAFYCNGGAKKIDEMLADPSFNVNHPELLQQLKKGTRDE